MNLKDFSLLGEDGKNYTIGHPKGKSIIVAKTGLSTKAHEAIKSLKKHQNFDEGTPEGIDDEGTDNGAPAAETIPINVSQTPQITPTMEDTLNDTEPQKIPESDEGDQSQVDSVAQAELQPQGATAANPTMPIQAASSNVAPNYQAGLQNAIETTEEAQGAHEEATKASQEAFTQAAEALGTPEDLSKTLKTSDQRLQELNIQGDAYRQAIESGKVDPRRYFHNMSVTSRISAGIGTLLSGLGQGLTGGGPNMAMQAMNAAMDRDVEAQKNDQSKMMNLYKMNREAYGNEMQAKLQTKNQMLASAEMQTKAAMANAQGADAQARLAPALLGFQQQQAMNNWMISRSQGVAGGTEQAHLNDMGTMQRLNPELYKDMQGKYLPSVGTSATPLSEKDRDAARTYDELGNSINKAINFTKTVGTTLPFTAKNDEANAIRQDLVTGFQHLHNLNRLSDVDLKLNMSNLSSPGAFRSQGALAQFNQLLTENNNKKQTLYNQLGIKPFQKAASDQTAVAWAKANPNDPRSALIMQRAAAAGVQ